ncbi:hypothetical protein BGX38DRAFT_269223 [Terfezia claveryi]|nr:hypothetical protein BGX38DRAFT_269223 [Terfezia claveryi]
MVVPRISFLDALSRGEVSWLTPPSEASDSDSDLSEAPLYPSSPGTISAMRRIPDEEVPSREVVQVRGLQQGRVVKRNGSGEMEGTGERGSSGRGKGSGLVREGKGVGKELRKAGEDMGEVERTPFEIVEKRYACAVGLEKWERGTMIVWAGGEREVRLKVLCFSFFPGEGVCHCYLWENRYPGSLSGSSAPNTPKNQNSLDTRDLVGLRENWRLT